MRLIPLILISIALGCQATVPLSSAVDDTRAKDRLDGTGNLYIVRPPGYFGGAIMCRVSVGDRMLGGLAPGTYFVERLSFGRTTVSVFGNENQDTLDVTLPVAGNAFVEVSPAWGWATARFKLKQLDEASGKKQVLKSKLAKAL